MTAPTGEVLRGSYVREYVPQFPIVVTPVGEIVAELCAPNRITVTITTVTSSQLVLDEARLLVLDEAGRYPRRLRPPRSAESSR